MAENAELLVTIVADTEKVQKQVQEELSEKPVQVKAELDDKGFDTGRIRGFLKEVQQFSARIADGGVSKGFSQLGEGAKNFTSALGSGKGIADAFSSATHAVGVEGLAVAGGLMAAGAAVYQVGKAMVEATVASSDHSRAINQLNTDYAQIQQSTQGLITIQQALALQNAAVSSGFSLSSQQLGVLSEETLRLGASAGGDTAGQLQLMQAALHGNADAAIQMGVSLDGARTSTEVANRTLAEMSSRNHDLGGAVATAGQQFERFKQQASEMGQGLLSIFGQVNGLLFGHLIAGFRAAFEGLSSLIAAADQGLRRLTGNQNEAAAQDLDLQNRRLIAAQQRRDVEERTHQAQMTALNVQNGLLLTQLDLINQGSIVDGQRITVEQQLAQVRHDLIFAVQRDGESQEEFLRRRIGLEQQFNDLSRQSTAEQQRTQELQMQGGLLQHQIDLAHIHMGIGYAALTPLQAEAQLRQQINQLLTVASQANRALTNDEQARVQALAQQAVSMRQQAVSAAQQGAQAAQQRRDAIFQLQVANELALARVQIANATVHHLDISRELNLVEGRIFNFNLSGRALTTERIEQYNRLVQRAQTLRQAEQEIQDIHRNGVPLQESDIRLIDRALTGIQAQGEAQQNLNDIGRMDLDVYSQRISLQRDAQNLQVQTLQGALQAQFQGDRLNAQQRASLQNVQATVDGINQRLQDNNQRQQEITATLADTNLPEARRNELLQERNQLLQDTGQLQTSLQDVDYARNGVDALQQLTQATRQFAGEYRSSSSVLGSLASSAMGTMTGAFKQHLTAVLQGKETIGEALKGMLNDTLTALASEAAIKAIFQTAEGFAALATYRPAEAAQHFGAAGIYTAVAVASGAGAALTMPSGTSSSGTSGGSSPSAPGAISPVSNGSNTPPVPGNYTININGSMYLTKEQVEDAIHNQLKDHARRTGYPY